jgi:hypothetical protein
MNVYSYIITQHTKYLLHDVVIGDLYFVFFHYVTVQLLMFLMLSARCLTQICNYSIEYLFLVSSNMEARSVIVVKALRYKPAGRGFDSRWRHWNVSVT